MSQSRQTRTSANTSSPPFAYICTYSFTVQRSVVEWFSEIAESACRPSSSPRAARTGELFIRFAINTLEQMSSIMPQLARIQRDQLGIIHRRTGRAVLLVVGARARRGGHSFAFGAARSVASGARRVGRVVVFVVGGLTTRTAANLNTISNVGENDSTRAGTFGLIGSSKLIFVGENLEEIRK